METPERMAAGVAALVDAGATIIGGCCGTTPAHIRLFRAELSRLGRG
jgi:5-methyltetrahydrofolate--homocysteine methyltransferase